MLRIMGGSGRLFTRGRSWRCLGIPGKASHALGILNGLLDQITLPSSGYDHYETAVILSLAETLQKGESVCQYAPWRLVKCFLYEIGATGSIFVQFGLIRVVS